MGKTKYAVFTMDVEDFSDTECVSAAGIHAEVDLLDGLDEYIRLLDRHGIKSTLFTVGKLAPRIAHRIRSYIASGHRLALHSYDHVAPMDVGLEQFREQTKAAKDAMECMFTTAIRGFRAPCFSMDKNRLDVLQELGFRYDSSDLGFSGARHTVQLDLSSFEQLRPEVYCRGGFYEFGLSKQKLFGRNFPISGGGYVRLSNWNFIRSLLWQYLRRSDYYVFYLHPFELTRQKVPVYRQLKSYDRFYLSRGLGTFRTRVEWIIKVLKKCGYQFVTFEQLADIMDQEQKETVSV